jgi:hypothetical protein
VGASRHSAFAAAGRAGAVADVFVVGGAAMALAHDATRVTRDVDATFLPHGIVIEEARNVADALGLPYWWLNEQASIYISGKDDPGKRPEWSSPSADTGTPAQNTAEPSAQLQPPRTTNPQVIKVRLSR